MIKRLLSALIGANVDSLLGTRDETIRWHSVAKNGMPKTNQETVFYGVNTNGYRGCFNHIDETGTCIYCTAEENIIVMSGLKEWAKASQ